MFFTYIECTTLVIICISSNKHLCFYYIEEANFVTAIPKKIATGQITECGKLSNKWIYHTTIEKTKRWDRL